MMSNENRIHCGSTTARLTAYECTQVAPAVRLLIALLVSAVAAGLAYVVLSLPLVATGLKEPVADQLALSGVSHPLTAVLLNFRGYDTLLEMSVLLLALVGVWSLDSAPSSREHSTGAVLDRLTRLLTTLMILIAGYLLWVGAHAPGGAFQAGAVLGAAGVLLLLSGWRLPAPLAGWPLRLALIAGVAVFAAVAAGVMWTRASLLEYPPQWAGGLIMLIETAATLSIGATLAALFLGGRPEDSP
jgi:multisubunit Na+/H+ antiporter MnhB subunit